MPHKQRHRGPHPRDAELFAPEQVPRLREATRDLCWLYTRGYAEKAALKIVGDHYQLSARQRTAVSRSACADASLARRAEHHAPAAELRGKSLLLDGYNVLITAEHALAGGVLIHARDGCIRDMASLHGSYRRVEETRPALLWIGARLASFELSSIAWYFDTPVSNSGRLRAYMAQLAEESGWTWHVELHHNPDRLLAEAAGVVITSDSWVLNQAAAWHNLSAALVAELEAPWLIDLRPEAD